MRPEAIGRALAGLEAAGEKLRARPAAERMSALGRVLDAWADPASPVRRRLLAEHPPAAGLSRETVAAGLELALPGWNARALERLVAGELGSRDALEAARLPGVTTVIHGGVLPMPTLLDGLLPLLLGSPVASKPAVRDPVTPRLVRASLEDAAPELADGFAVVDVRRADGAALSALLDAARVVVTGSDEAVAAVADRIGPRTRLVAHGHKLSLAVLGDAPDADLPGAAKALSVDVALWDQTGCLSPVACWVVGPPERAATFAGEMAKALAARERQWPRGEVETAAAAIAAHERIEAELRAAAGRGVALHVGEDSAWTVVSEADPAPRPAPLHRFLRVHPVPDLDALARAVASLRPFVTGIALAGFGAGSGASAAIAWARRLGASRTAPFGRLQAPPLDWPRDGLGPLASLLPDGAPG